MREGAANTLIANRTLYPRIGFMLSPGRRKSCGRSSEIGGPPTLTADQEMARFMKWSEDMKLPKTILVPTDFSECSEVALDYAVALASRLDAKIHLLNVVDIQVTSVEYGGEAISPSVGLDLTTNRKGLERLIVARAAKVAFGPPLLETGDARAQIEQIAAKIGADLIVMGTHGRRGVKRLLLGSVAETVVRTAPCPVLLVRQDAAR